MYPLMKNGDLLRYSTVFDSLSPGDVVLFRDSGENIVVHRIVGECKSGFITRGDATFTKDPDTVPENALVGLVSSVERKNRSIPVWRGAPGLLQMALGHILRLLLIPLRISGRFLYRTLATTGICRLFWKPAIRSLSFQTPHGTLVKIVWKRRTVARWWPDSDRFVCRFPFALFLTRPGPW